MDASLIKPDLQNRADIDKLLRAFYARAMSDALIGHFFTEVVKLDLESHLPRITDFWENILFQSAVYAGNPMQQHRAIHQLSPLSAEHFIQWVALFHATADEMFEGPVAEMAKLRAANIAALMQHKVIGGA